MSGEIGEHFQDEQLITIFQVLELEPTRLIGRKNLRRILPP